MYTTIHTQGLQYTQFTAWIRSINEILELSTDTLSVSVKRGFIQNDLIVTLLILILTITKQSGILTPFQMPSKI